MQLQHDEIRRIYDNIGMMDEDIKNQSIYTVEDTYIKELKKQVHPVPHSHVPLSPREFTWPICKYHDHGP